MTPLQILLLLLFTMVLDWILLRLWSKRKELRNRFLHLPKINTTPIFLISGLVFIILGLRIMNLNYLLIDTDDFFNLQKSINEIIRLDIDYLGNSAIGLALLICGGFFFIKSLKEASFSTGNDDTNPEEGPVYPPFSVLLKRPVLFSIITAVVLFTALMVRMFMLQNSIIDPFLWLVVIALTGFSIAKSDIQTSNLSVASSIKRSDVVLLLFLVAFGLLIASYKLTTHPNIMIGDEGNFFETAKGISTGEYLPSLFDLGVYSYPVASSYWQGLILRLFGNSLWAWRFSSVLMSVLAVIPLYFLGFDMFGRRIALLASISFLSAPYFLAFARLGYNNSQVFLPVTMTVWLLYRGVKRSQRLLIYFAGVAAGLGFLTYTAARISLVFGLAILGGWMIYCFLKRSLRATFKQKLIFTCLFILGWIVTAGPHLAFGSTVDTIAFRYKTLESSFFNMDAAIEYYDESEILSGSQVQKVDDYRLYFNPKIYLWLFQRGFLRTMLAFFQPGLTHEHFVTSPLPGLIPSFFLVIGLAICLSRLRDKRFLLLLVWFFLVVIFLSTLNTFPPRHTHMVPLIPVMAVLIALGLDKLVESFLGAFKTQQKRIRKALLTTGGSLIVIAGVYHYFITIPTVFRPNVDQVINWAELSNDKNVPFFYITNQEDYQDWKPFFIGRVIPDRPFYVINEQTFLENKRTFPDDDEAVYVFDQGKFDEITKKIQKKIKVSTYPLNIFSAEGNLIGGILIKGGFVWPLQATFIQEIYLLLTSPAGIMSLVLLVNGIVLFAENSFQQRRRYSLL